MKSYTKVFIPLMLAVILGSLTYVFSQSTYENKFTGRPLPNENFGPPHGKSAAGLPPHILNQLNLTAAQIEQIETLRSTSRAVGEEFSGKIRQADEQLRGLVESGNFNESQARQILGEKANAMTEMELVRLQTDTAIYNLLTGEQKTKLDTLKSERPPGRPERGKF